MESREFSTIRGSLKKTQKQMAELLGTSIKAIHSYEQGWRKVPGHVERHLYFLLSRQSGKKNLNVCWKIKKCPNDRKKECPAWEFKAGTLCWFICGTRCEGKVQKNWNEKMEICRTCEVLTSSLDNSLLEKTK